MFFIHAAQSIQAASFIEQENVLANRLPHLHAALHNQGKHTSSLIEYLDHLVQTHHGSNTWHLKDDARDYIKNLLQIIDTITAEHRDQTTSTIVLQGNPGTLPIALLAASLITTGRHDVSIQIVSPDRIPSRRHLHGIIRTFLGKTDRCFVQQFTTADAFTAKCGRYLRKPDTIISFAGNPKDLARFCHQPLIFDYVAGVVQ